MIAISINWSKIDSSLLYQGKKDDYLNITLKDNKDGKDQYGNDGFVTQDVSAEERKAGVRGPIIGNWKHIGGSTPQRQQQPDDRQQRRQRPEPPARRERPVPPPARRPSTPDPDLDAPEDDIPF